MKIHHLVAAMAAVTFLATPPALSEGRPFPGKGDLATWEKACGHFNQGINLYRSGNYSKAIEQYKQAIEIYPHDYDFYNNLGLTYKKNSQFDLAVDALKKSIDLKPNIWESWSNLGGVYKHQKKAHEAAEAFAKALQYNPPAKSKNLIMQNLAAMRAEEKAPSEVSPSAAGAPAVSGAKSSSSNSAPISPGAPVNPATDATSTKASEPVPIPH